MVRQRRFLAAGSRRSQASMEFLFIVGFSILLFMPVLILYGSEREDVVDRINTNQANEIIKKVVDASETVYYMGEPSKMTIKAYIPRNVESVAIGGNEIIFFVRFGDQTGEVVGYSEVNMTGSIAPDPGIRSITVEAEGDHVKISSS